MERCFGQARESRRVSLFPTFILSTPFYQPIFCYFIIRVTYFFALRRASQHIRHLLDSISQFPTINPSASDPASEEIDIPKLLRQIRSRYKVLCSCLGERPRLQSAEVVAMEDKGDAMDEDEGPTRTTPGSAIPVWQI